MVPALQFTTWDRGARYNQRVNIRFNLNLAASGVLFRFTLNLTGAVSCLSIILAGNTTMLQIRFEEADFDELVREVKDTSEIYSEKVIGMLRDFYVYGVERKEISEKNDVSRSYVSRMLNRFIKDIGTLGRDDIKITLTDHDITLTGKMSRNESKD